MIKAIQLLADQHTGQIHIPCRSLVVAGMEVLKQRFAVDTNNHVPHVIIKDASSQRWVRLREVEKYNINPLNGDYEIMPKDIAEYSATKPNIRWRVFNPPKHHYLDIPPVIASTMDKYYIVGVDTKLDSSSLVFVGEHNTAYQYDYPQDFPDTLVSKLAVVMGRIPIADFTVRGDAKLSGFPYIHCTVPGFEDIGWPIANNPHGFVLVVTAKEAEEWRAHEHVLRTEV